MEAAKLAVAEFTARRGHTTEVNETVLPAVTREVIKPTRHEITTEAVDREVHQHHYHLTVQPLSHTETLPTKHVHNLIPIKHTTHEHDDVERTKARVAEELAVFKDSRTILPVVHTRAEMPAVVGEHYHHHVHETVQPIIFREVHAPEVVHTTIPIHEMHHYEPVHHGISEMTGKPLVEFTKLGGLLTGSKAPTRETYDGAPRPYLKELATTTEKLGFGRVNNTTTAPRNHTSTRTTTSTTTSVTHRPAPINTTVAQKTNTSTPARAAPLTGVSRSSSASSSDPSMPSTPTNHKFADPAIRTEGGMSPPMSPQRASMESKQHHGGFLGRIRSRGHGTQPTVEKY